MINGTCAIWWQIGYFNISGTGLPNEIHISFPHLHTSAGLGLCIAGSIEDIMDVGLVELGPRNHPLIDNLVFIAVSTSET